MATSLTQKSIMQLDDRSSTQIVTATTGQTAPYLEEAWPIDYIEPFAKRGDPLADKIMQILYAEGRADAEKSGNPADRPRRILQFLQLLINQLTIPDPEKEHPFGAEDPDYMFTPEVREAMREFLREAPKLPAWMDVGLMERAQEIFADNPVIAYVLLACLSIPVLYTCGRGGVQVLILTEQINTKVRRRLIETGSLIMSVMQNGSFTKPSAQSNLTNPLPPGIEGTLRVRLLHAASRTVIHEFWKDGVRDRAAEKDKPASEPSKVRQYHGKPGDQIWREEWGIPISQQYLAGTLMTFSYTNIYGLEKLGVFLDDHDKKAFMHLWNVFGYVLGIEEELLLRLDFPRTNRAVYSDGVPVHAASGEEMCNVGRALYKRVMDLNRSNEPEAIQDGIILTEAINNYIGDLLIRKIPMAKLLRINRLPILMMDTLLSKDDMNLLGVKRTFVEKLISPIAVLILRLRGLVTATVGLPANAIANMIFRYMQQETADVYAELQAQTGVRYPGIPEEFQKKWGLLKENTIK